MEIEVEFQSGIPLYEQIIHQLQALIEEGSLSPGDQLPTTRQLAGKLGINFNTVARAYRKLSQEGLISTQPGRGTFVLNPKGKTTSIKGKPRHIEALTRYYLRKAAFLGFEPEEIKDYFEKIVQKEKE
ncbi:MAG TPA: GntR family transcriptional regulator [Chloroflexi bacterium]|nr:MAG: GntR family transcriptional regulator [Chloroflexota bacterium]HDD55613.1 GntR family transcriptional regulator [Chloroflexota bacterium]